MTEQVPDLNAIEMEWRRFCLACFGDIGTQQYIDLRRTFYGGAAALFGLFMNMLDPGEEPTEADLTRISALQAEILAFNEAVKNGRS